MTRKKAAALKYDKNYENPIVTAIGFGSIADIIIDKANKNDVPVVENNELVESLSQLEIGQSIPPELYETVAKIIAFVYNLNETYKNKIDGK
jgi:flagellar biosynthesis protein